MLVDYGLSSSLRSWRTNQNRCSAELPHGFRKTLQGWNLYSMTNRIGVALIGAGMIAERHVSALAASLSRARLVAVVSRHPERARHLAQHYEGPSPLFTSDLSKIVSDPTVQVAIVATPPNVRIDLIKTLALLALVGLVGIYVTIVLIGNFNLL